MVEIAAVASPAINAAYRVLRRRRVTRGAMAEKALAGASAVPAVFVLLSPFSPTFLSPIADQPFFLIPAAVITIIYTVGSVFDWSD